MKEIPRIFLSYAREDEVIAKRLYNDLKAAGARPWLDSENLRPGQDWQLEIEREIRSADHILVLQSRNSARKRGFVQKEVRKALDVLESLPEASEFIIPVRLDDSTSMYSKLEGIHEAALFPSYESGLRQILRTILPNFGKVQVQATFSSLSGAVEAELSSVGWGVIFASEISSQIRRALQPLLDLRRDQARDLYCEPTVEPGDSVQKFLSRMNIPFGSVNPHQLPLYLLIVGDPSAIPWSFQQQLATRYRVGRISFEEAEQYSRYAAGALANNQQLNAGPRTVKFFGVQHTGDQGSRIICGDLVEPLCNRLMRQFPSWSIQATIGGRSTKERLYGIHSRPSKLLFVGAHGLEFPCGDPRQLAEQGAIVCGDWHGPGEPVSRKHYFTSEDVDKNTNFTGCFGFLFCDYSCGASEFDETGSLSEIGERRIAPRAFVSRLAQRLLSNPGGAATAVVGTVGRLWSSSFTLNGVGGHVGTYADALGEMLGGRSAGSAFEHFSRRYSELAVEYSRLAYLRGKLKAIDHEEFDRASRDMHDAKGLVLLGDPAARIAAD